MVLLILRDNLFEFLCAIFGLIKGSTQEVKNKKLVHVNSFIDKSFNTVCNTKTDTYKYLTIKVCRVYESLTMIMKLDVYTVEPQ